MEVDLTGINPISYPHMAAWEWQVPLYLFLGGLVAGLMVIAAMLRINSLRSPHNAPPAAVQVADLSAFPLLVIGLLLLWWDLANRWNAWRFYTTFKVTSAMSWGAWILLLAMIVLGLRFLNQLAQFPLWEAKPQRRGLKPFYSGWRVLMAWGRFVAQGSRLWDALSLLLGLGIGLYTGLLLSTIPARPLWNSAVLAPLFLVSGLASASAFLHLLTGGKEQRSLLSMSLLAISIELLLILAYVLNLSLGGQAAQRAAELLRGENFAWAFWGVAISGGLLLPGLVESLEALRRRVPRIIVVGAPILKLAGGVALRYVIVYAGLQSFV